VKFTCATPTFANAAADLARIVAKTTTIPILKNIKIVAADKSLTLHATNLEIGLTATLTADIEQPGETTVDANVLTKYLGASTNPLVNGDQLENTQFSLTNGRAKVALNTLPASDFPTVETGAHGATFNVSASMLAVTFGSTTFAASDEEAKGAALQSVRFRVNEDGTASMAATDGYILALHPIILDVASIPTPGDYLIPAYAGAEIAKLLGKLDKETSVEIGLVPANTPEGPTNHISFRTVDRLLTIRLVNARYPKLEDVIPKAYDRSVTVNTKEFIAALRRSAIMDVHRGISSVIVTIAPNRLSIDAKNATTGSAHEEIDAETNGDEDLTIAFNADHLLQVASHIASTKVRLDLLGPQSPVALRPADDDGTGEDLYIVMPMRL
jgi:DNA polymerase-3 subunit beta